MRLPSLAPRDLEPLELEQLLQRLAGPPAWWRPHVEFSVERRHFVSLHRDDHVDLWLLCWTELSDTGWHDHDISSGAVRVLEGALLESSPRLGGAPVIRQVSTGESFCFGPEHIHRLSGAPGRAVSLHAYSPPLWRLGQYSIDGDGVMRRYSISYAEELRPLHPPVAA